MGFLKTNHKNNKFLYYLKGYLSLFIPNTFYQFSLENLLQKITEKDFIRLSALTKYNTEEFTFNETLIDVLSHQKCDNMWFDKHGFESDHIGKARLFRSGTPDRRVLNLQCWITVPDYVVRMLNMSLDSYIDLRFHMERFTKIADSLETSEEIKIFQMFLFQQYLYRQVLNF